MDHDPVVQPDLEPHQDLHGHPLLPRLQNEELPTNPDRLFGLRHRFRTLDGAQHPLLLHPDSRVLGQVDPQLLHAPGGDLVSQCRPPDRYRLTHRRSSHAGIGETPPGSTPAVRLDRDLFSRTLVCFLLTRFPQPDTGS